MSKLSIVLHEAINFLTIPISYRIGKALRPPQSAGLFLTQRCNSRCSICHYWKTQDYENELSTDEWLKVVRELKQLGVTSINFTADGEIFTRSDAFEIMRHAQKLGFLLFINTNGLTLDRYIEEIIALHPFQITVSLDAFDDSTYHRLRGVSNGFTRVTQNILALKQAGYANISVGSVLTKDNLDDLLQLQQFSHDHGFLFRVTAFQFEGFGGSNTALRKAYQTPEFLEKLDTVINTLVQAPINNTSTYLERIKEYFVRPQYHPFCCVIGFYSIFIFPNGDIALCNLMRQDAVIGNVRHQSLKDVWYSRRADDVRQKIREKKCLSCWLSCFAEQNIRFTPSMFLKNVGYFGQKAIRLLK